ncbi:pyridoxamine 5'-phosphate oxidase family protein [Georgenia sunbinii]|uniref:pyridoxamine 5'-phosphate oxidase family protein n=1 Tax=Georgenia sunbinii TaxID=3117728 RepID=UPI002F26B686
MRESIVQEPTTSSLDPRFSDPAAVARPWQETEDALAAAELYWLGTVRGDGRPHATPMVGVWHDGTLCFCTGVGEQKQRNLTGNTAVTVTTGTNAWTVGSDVVIEGHVERVITPEGLTAIADAFLAKYGEAWRFEVSGQGFASPGGLAWVLRVAPERAFCFAKDLHGQTTYRWPEG